MRTVLDDQVGKARVAKKLLKKMVEGTSLFISSCVILEMAWVLEVKKQARAGIYEAVLDLIDSTGITVGQRDVIARALELYGKGKADFGDYFILAEGEYYNSPTLATFDKNFTKDNARAKHLNQYL